MRGQGAVCLILGLFYSASTYLFLGYQDGRWWTALFGLGSFVGAIAFTFLTTWAKGRQLMISRMNEASLPMEIFIKSAAPSAARGPGTAVFMTSSASGVPHALLHNLKHNKVLHERVVFLTIVMRDIPYVPDDERFEITDLGYDFYRLLAHYGFKDAPDIPELLEEMEGIAAGLTREGAIMFYVRRVGTDKLGGI